MNKQKARLTEGPVGRHLVDMTVPVLFGIGTMMAQSLIDTWFIGQIGKCLDLEEKRLSSGRARLDVCPRGRRFGSTA